MLSKKQALKALEESFSGRKPSDKKSAPSCSNVEVMIGIDYKIYCSIKSVTEKLEVKTINVRKCEALDLLCESMKSKKDHCVKYLCKLIEKMVFYEKDDRAILSIVCVIACKMGYLNVLKVMDKKNSLPFDCCWQESNGIRNLVYNLQLDCFRFYVQVLKEKWLAQMAGGPGWILECFSKYNSIEAENKVSVRRGMLDELFGVFSDFPFELTSGSLSRAPIYLAFKSGSADVFKYLLEKVRDNPIYSGRLESGAFYNVLFPRIVEKYNGLNMNMIRILLDHCGDRLKIDEVILKASERQACDIVDELLIFSRKVYPLDSVYVDTWMTGISNFWRCRYLMLRGVPLQELERFDYKLFARRSMKIRNDIIVRLPVVLSGIVLLYC
ncbi:MAG: hypothetical protein Hyperionvirus2_70 [Hyperionvirus sp.]|uniref:Ankyrin repeat protein n=1 Tax=Hyperionvirus sp. TaxID=2487770 RepID=A0A3G5A6P1_9VIRU|nr:MAG: hypothetical protein Hyperionvirus2_70 [Hyperionvirus sp.]